MKLSQTEFHDRFLLHTLFNVKYSVEQLQPITSTGSHLITEFEVRSIHYSSALVIVPGNERWPLVTVCSPFFVMNQTDDDVDSILLPLRLYLSKQDPFDIELIRCTNPSHSQWILDGPSRQRLEEVRQDIERLFSPFQFTHHQVDVSDQRPVSRSSPQSMRLTVRELCLVDVKCHENDLSYAITHRIPIACVLEPIGVNPSARIHTDLASFFKQMDLYPPDASSYHRKQQKFHYLSESIDQFFGENEMHRFTYALLPYGSYRLVSHSVQAFIEDRSDSSSGFTRR